VRYLQASVGLCRRELTARRDLDLSPLARRTRRAPAALSERLNAEVELTLDHLANGVGPWPQRQSSAGAVISDPLAPMWVVPPPPPPPVKQVTEMLGGQRVTDNNRYRETLNTSTIN
jgi:hypothetical protein